MSESVFNIDIFINENQGEEFGSGYVVLKFVAEFEVDKIPSYLLNF